MWSEHFNHQCQKATTGS